MSPASRFLMLFAWPHFSRQKGETQCSNLLSGSLCGTGLGPWQNPESVAIHVSRKVACNLFVTQPCQNTRRLALQLK